MATLTITAVSPLPGYDTDSTGQKYALQYAIYLGHVRIARLPLEWRMGDPMDVTLRAILERIGHVREIRLRCPICGSTQTGGSLAGGLYCIGDRPDDPYRACLARKELGQQIPPQTWYVVRTAFHGGGIRSQHNTLGGAHRAARKARIGDCVCGCAGVVPAEEYAELRAQEGCRNPYALTRS